MVFPGLSSIILDNKTRSRIVARPENLASFDTISCRIGAMGKLTPKAQLKPKVHLPERDVISGREGRE